MSDSDSKQRRAHRLARRARDKWDKGGSHYPRGESDSKGKDRKFARQLLRGLSD
jgi:hypothetical protein